MIGGGESGFDFINKLIIEAASDIFNIELISLLLIFKNHVQPTVDLLESAGRNTRVVLLKAGTRTRYLILGKQSQYQ